MTLQSVTESCYHPLVRAYTAPATSGALTESMESFPRFCAWIQEPQDDVALDEATRILKKALTAIISRQLLRAGFRENDEIEDCRNSVFLFMENKLSEPMEFLLDKVTCATQASVEQLKTIHLLNPEPFTLFIYHPDLQWTKFHAALYELNCETQLLAVSDISCDELHRVPIQVAYNAVRHGQEIRIEVLADNSERGYHSGVKLVCHESFQIRMGFVASTARNISHEHVRMLRKGWIGQTETLEALDIPASGDEARQHSYVSLARRTLLELPPLLQEQMIKHYLDGFSWNDIAEESGLSEAKIKKDASRALRKIAETMISEEPEAATGAVKRIVNWLKEMLPHILEQGR